jgi:lipopolysaccharide/colanic/teichoic acid biosynthesis glycosyltransferase
MDIYYLEHQSLWMDAKILMQTFFSIIGGKRF